MVGVTDLRGRLDIKNQNIRATGRGLNLLSGQDGRRKNEKESEEPHVIEKMLALRRWAHRLLYECKRRTIHLRVYPFSEFDDRWVRS